MVYSYSEQGDSGGTENILGTESKAKNKKKVHKNINTECLLFGVISDDSFRPDFCYNR